MAGRPCRPSSSSCNSGLVLKRRHGRALVVPVLFLSVAGLGGCSKSGDAAGLVDKAKTAMASGVEKSSVRHSRLGRPFIGDQARCLRTAQLPTQLIVHVSLDVDLRVGERATVEGIAASPWRPAEAAHRMRTLSSGSCLLYTSDAADE